MLLLLLLLLLLSRGLPYLFWHGRIVSIMPTGNGDNENKNRYKSTPLSRGLQRSFFSVPIGL